jgi:lipoprotein-anchoring transpeptidase ErfK/SrfK
MPGVTIGGVDVSGMTRTEAIAAVRDAAAITLSEPLTVSVGHQHWTVTPETLGRRAAVAASVRDALAAGDDLGTFDRAWHRIRGSSLGLDVPLTYDTQGDAIEKLVATIAAKVAVDPQNAALQLNAAMTDVEPLHAKNGMKLNVGQATQKIAAALEDGASKLSLDTRSVAPTVTDDSLGRTIVVRIDQNRLYLYDGFNVLRSFTVATAKPGFTTPDGDWKIYDKRVDPTWYNPAVDGWGADLPAVIPGGPGNPMGPRAIYITAPGLIRIHGTTDDASIGRYASHGCIRMHNEEVIQLYDMIDVGDHVLIAGTRPASAGYWSVPPASDI